jgi:hypothetical protein
VLIRDLVDKEKRMEVCIKRKEKERKILAKGRSSSI